MGDEAVLLKAGPQLHTLLQRAIDIRALLGITMPRVLRTTSSLLMDIDLQHQKLKLDAPINTLAPEPNAPLRVHCRIDGAQFEFVSDFLDADPRSWIVQLPEEALYLQRRNTYRLRVTRLPSVIGTHFFDSRLRFHGELVDISAFGLSARLRSGADTPIGTLMECVIDLPGSHVSCQAEVRWCQRGQHGTVIGILFHELAPPQQQRLSSAIAALQRQLLRGAA